jgi:hypothetical protein
MYKNGWIFAGGVLTFFALGVFVWLFKRLPPEVPWLYSLPWGEQQLVSKVWFGASLGGVLLALGACAWFCKILSKEDVRAGVMLARGGFFLTVIYLLSFFQVLRLMI